MLLAGTSQGYALVQRHVVPDDGGLTDDHAVAVVDEQPFADGGTGMDLNARLADSPLRDPSGQKIMSFTVQFVRNPIVKHHLKAGVKKYLQGGMNGRVAFLDDPDLLLDIADYAHVISLQI